MEIRFQTPNLQHLCNDDKAARRYLGGEGAKKLRRRLDDLDAASTLAVMRQLPGRCHELRGELAMHLAIDLDGGRRLVFRPVDPIPTKDDGGLDWSRVTAILITSIENYHE